MSALAWVVGRGGLLGSAVERVLGPLAGRPDSPLAWGDDAASRATIGRAADAFAARLRAEPRGGWSLYWCAGAGVVGTSADRLQVETASLRLFLDRLSSTPEGTLAGGRVFLASSAGGVYGGSREGPLTETTLPVPISDYGREKLAQEELLRTWARVHGVSSLVGRLSNLYGPGQRLDKPQGLISHLSRCLIHGVPAHIYVPLDTIRDYIFADDAAWRIVSGMARLRAEWPDGGGQVTKLYGSEREVTVGGLLGVFRRLGRRQLRVVAGLHPVGALQPARVHLRSSVWTDEAPPFHTELLDGVSRVYRHQLALYQAGRLARPVTEGRR